MMRKLQNMDTTRRLYCFIRHYTATNRLPPTQREIADACFISTGTVTRHLDRLQMFGYIERLDGAPRGIVLTDKEPMDCTEHDFD